MALDALESFEEDDELQRAASDPASCVCSGSISKIMKLNIGVWVCIMVFYFNLWGLVIFPSSALTPKTIVIINIKRYIRAFFCYK